MTPADEAVLQEKVQRLQALAQQLQAAGSQRAQLEMLHNETERAAAALAELPEGTPVYRSVGSLLVRDDPKKAADRLADEKETLEVRRKRVAAQEEELQKRFESLQEEVQKALQ